MCGSRSTQRGSAPLSLHGRDRQTPAPRAPNLLCYQRYAPKASSPSSSPAVCPRQHHHLHSIHPLIDTLHRRIAFECSLGRRLGLRGGLIQSRIGPNTHIIHQRHRNKETLKQLFLLTRRPLTHKPTMPWSHWELFSGIFRHARSRAVITAKKCRQLLGAHGSPRVNLTSTWAVYRFPSCVYSRNDVHYNNWMFNPVESKNTSAGEMTHHQYFPNLESQWNFTQKKHKRVWSHDWERQRESPNSSLKWQMKKICFVLLGCTDSDSRELLVRFLDLSFPENQTVSPVGRLWICTFLFRKYRNKRRYVIVIIIKWRVLSWNMLWQTWNLNLKSCFLITSIWQNSTLSVSHRHGMIIVNSHTMLQLEKGKRPHTAGELRSGSVGIAPPTLSGGQTSARWSKACH